MEIIYVTPFTILKVNMSNIRTPSNTTITTPLLLPISTHHRNIHVYMKLLCVKKLPFLDTKSYNMNFFTIRATISISKQQIISGITYIKNIYTRRGFVITYFHGHNEFDVEEVRSTFLPTTLHIYSKG